MGARHVSVKVQWELTRYFKDRKLIGFPEMKAAMLGVKRLAVLVRDYTDCDLTGLKDKNKIVRRGYDFLKKKGEIIKFYENRKTTKKKTYCPADRSKFYNTPEWRSIRYVALKMYERKCMCCGRNPHDHGIVIHVDHIKPRSTHPELELDVGNLQLMCEDCNLGKSNTDEIDYRPKICAYCNHKITEETKCSPESPCRPKYQLN